MWSWSEIKSIPESLSDASVPFLIYCIATKTTESPTKDKSKAVAPQTESFLQELCVCQTKQTFMKPPKSPCRIKIFKHYVTMDWTPEQSTVVSKFHQGSDICQHQISSGKHPGFQSIFMLNNQSIYQFHAITNFFISATK